MEKSDYLKIDGKQLRLLVTIYETGSLTRAGDVLDMHQSTISYGLDRLREQLGDKLFVRSGQGVIATARTEELIEQARGLLHQLRAFALPDTYDPSVDTGVLRIATNALERDLLLKQVLDKMRELAPQLAFKVRASGSQHDVIEGLREGSIDIALFPALQGDIGDIKQRVLLSFEDGVFFDPMRRKGPTDLLEYCACHHAQITLGQDAHSDVDSLLKEKGLDRRVMLQVGDFDTLASLMKGTDLVAILPTLFKKGCFSEFSYVDPSWENKSRRLAMLWHVRQHATNRNKFWRDQIAAIAKNVDVTG